MHTNIPKCVLNAFHVEHIPLISIIRLMFSFLNSPVRNTEHITCNDWLTLSTKGECYGKKD